MGQILQMLMGGGDGQMRQPQSPPNQNPQPGGGGGDFMSILFPFLMHHFISSHAQGAQAGFGGGHQRAMGTPAPGPARIGQPVERGAPTAFAAPSPATGAPAGSQGAARSDLPYGANLLGAVKK